MKNKNDQWEKYKKSIRSKLNCQEIYKDIKNCKETTGSWISGKCPFHDDVNNSFTFNTKTLNWKCHAGCGGGDVFAFLMRSTGKTFKDILFELGDKYNIPYPYNSKPPIKEELVQGYKKSLAEEHRKYLKEKRGLSKDTIEKYEIGWDTKRKRYSIPIRDEQGKLVNIRLYSTTDTQSKMINYTADGGKWRYGKPARLYGFNELINYKEKQVIICNGEWDRVLLQQKGFMAVTSTHGCTTFLPEWIQYFEDKDIVIIFDCDEKGQEIAQDKALQAFKDKKVSSIKNVVLPLSGEKDDKDITDYFNKNGYSGEDLQKIIDETSAHIYEQEKEEEIIILESFTEIEKEELIDKKVQCEICVCGETSGAFHAVEEFKVTYCNKLKSGQCIKCMNPINIPHGSQEYIGSCMSTSNQVISMLRSFYCEEGQKPKINITKRTTIKEFFCHQKVNRISWIKDEDGNKVPSIDGKRNEIMEKKVYYLSSEDIKPGNYIAIGYVKTHPKTQQITFLIESLIPEEEDFQTFDLENNLDHLKAFRELSHEEIIKDLSDNVTGIYERDDLLNCILLTYCSPLWIRFNGEIIRGWLNSIIIGDSGTGKTQSFYNIAEFINIGDCFSGLTGTRTGLAYALENKNNGWQIRIGRYPANSRKILIIDETQYVHPEELRVISKGMDEGFMQVDRVQSGRYECMTRLIMICNPKDDRIMDNFSLGCDTLKGIFTSPFIRRTDIAVFANSGDLQDLSIINKKKDSAAQQKITSEMLRAAVFWAWSLKPDQVVFTSEAEDLCLSKTNEISERFGYAKDIPLVEPSDFRKTLARISAAFAVLLMSTDDNFSKLIIMPDHVKLAADLLSRIYSHDNCGLNEYSEIKKMDNQLLNYEDIEEVFLKKKRDEKHDSQNKAIFTKTIKVLRNNHSIKRDDLAFQVGCNEDSLKNTIRILKNYNLIDSTRNGYIKTPKFNKFLRRFLKNNSGFFDD